ncbi:MAG: DUF2855 family protein [Actinomycetota bacterium]
MSGRDLVVGRDDLHRSEILEGVGDDVGLAAGHALLRVDAFALTANNITYGVAGDLIGYWNFFPAEDGWGRIPVWGFADVVRSEVDGLEEGARVYGYLPMSTHLVVEPDRVRPTSFVDGSEHRSQLPPVYNRYRVVSAEPGHDPALEDLESLMRPLFTTSWLIDDFLADESFFGAEAVVLTSASSKTSFGTAFCLARREDHPVEVVGLTSPGNVDFVEGLGCYDTVLTYDDIAQLPADRPTVSVDMAGSTAVLSSLHHHLGDALRHSATVGMTHWDARSGTGALPGPEPTLFFAPARIEKRNADWGAGGMDERFGPDWAAFVAAVGDWVTIRHVRGAEAAKTAYLEMLDGVTPPDQAVIMSLHDAD